MALVSWPAGVPTYMVSWSEQAQPLTVRTSMDNSAVKVRKRFTGAATHVECATQLTQAHAELLRDFFNIDCQSGVNWFSFVNPMTGDSVTYRMMEAPLISNLGALGATVSMRWEHLPYWG